MDMQALIYVDQRDIRLTNVSIPTPKVDEVLIKVTAAGLCQTQVNEFIEGPYIIDGTNSNIEMSSNMIVGHEFGGVIEDVGDHKNDSGLLGAQVSVLPLLACGECIYCKKGLGNLCSSFIYYGLRGGNGGFAKYACVKKDNTYQVKNNSLLTFVEPLLVAIHAGNKIKNQIKESKICILGAGALGICVAAVFRDYFDGDVVINDILPGRLKRAEKAGFKVIGKSDMAPEYDVVIDCAGNDTTSKVSAFLESFNYLLKGGIFVNIGTYFHPLSFVPSDMLLMEHHIITSFLYNSRDISVLPEVIRSLKTDFSSLIMNIKLENIIEDGYYRAEVDKDSYTRLVVVP